MAKIKSGKPHPRFGATKATAKRYQELRDLKNRIFTLEQQLAATENNLVALAIEKNNHIAELDEQIRLYRKPPAVALRELCAMTVTEAVGLSLVRPLTEVAAWLATWEASQVATRNDDPKPWYTAPDGSYVRQVETMTIAGPSYEKAGTITFKNDDSRSDAKNRLSFAGDVDRVIRAHESATVIGSNGRMTVVEKKP
jgi:hypothetical protein